AAAHDLAEERMHHIGSLEQAGLRMWSPERYGSVGGGGARRRTIQLVVVALGWAPVLRQIDGLTPRWRLNATLKAKGSSYPTWRATVAMVISESRSRSAASVIRQLVK